MKIYLAGNTPGRLEEEKQLTDNGVNKYRLFSYYFYLTDVSMKEVFSFWRLK